MNASQVVITGWGSVSSAGLGAEALGRVLREGPEDLVEVDRTGGYHLACSARRAACVPAEALRSALAPREARRMSPPSRLAVVASRLALESAGLDPEGSGPGAVFLATEYGPTTYTERLLHQIFEEGPKAASPALFTESVANAPAAQVALKFAARGPNVTVTQRAPGALVAVARAAQTLAAGRADWALAGAAEEMNPLLHAVLDRFHTLARPDERGREVARPFDRRRSGVVLGEGANVLVFETAESAARRGTEGEARLVGFASAFDPSSPTTGWPARPDVLAASLRSRLGDALDGVGVVVSGACGGRLADRLEAELVDALLEGREVPVVAPCSTVGSWCGATLAPALMALRGERFGPVAGFEQAEPELPVTVWTGNGSFDARRVLVTSLGVGGSAAALILERGGTR